MALTVSQVARLTKLSVRALHHYDEIGLLRPSMRSEAGYRLYAQEDLERLQQVLFFRELGFALEDIRRIVTDPAFDVRAALQLQRQLLSERAARLSGLVQAVDAALAALDGGEPMDREQMFEAFGDFDPSRYEKEAEERWGHSEAYRESVRRAKRYKVEDWKRIRAEGEALTQALAAQLEAGAAATSEAAMDLAEQHRQHITRWFYPCSFAIHRGLAELYVADARFTENIDRTRPGLAAYWREAILANAARHGA